MATKRPWYIGWLVAGAYALLMFAIMSIAAPLLLENFPIQIGVPIGAVMGIAGLLLFQWLMKKMRLNPKTGKRVRSDND